MQLEPKDLLAKLEFDKVLNLTVEECVGELAKRAVLKIKPFVDPKIIKQKHKEVTELKNSFVAGDLIPLNVYEDISNDLKMLSIEGYVLSIEGLQRINKTLRGFAGIFQFFDLERQELYPTLFNILRPYEYSEELTKAIDKVIDEQGQIRPNASPALAKLRRQVGNKQRELDKQFKHILAEYRVKGWLSDSGESIRNSRRVLSVPSEHKRKIKGIIHDESSTGNTTFIEPEIIIQINNDIFDLEMAERQEIYRLLKELSTMLRPHVETLENYQTLLVEIDVIYSKARMASKMQATAPKLRNKLFFGIKEAYHPLLYLKNKAVGEKVVPFDLTLLNENRMLLVSGPNAGGKSVFMKAVGLLQIMMQSGFLIPVREDTELGVFSKLFVDIGDQQSLEDDLSTYSSRLENMKIFLRDADDETLILIDEFGSGTDPKSGGAIAEAILMELNSKKVFGILTTHYSNLKIFAFKTKGIVNGAMYFDQETLDPTYELKIGRPGSSYAFEIAQKIGLPAGILKYARKRAGKNERAVDQLLVDLQREKKEVEDKLEQLNTQRKDVNRLMKSYADLNRNLEFRRKKIKLDLKEQELQSSAKENKQIQKAIKEIREAQNLEEAKKLAQQAKEARKKLAEQVTNLKEEVFEPLETAAKGVIQEGSFVKMRDGGSIGKVESIKKNKAVLKIGELRMTVALRDLVLSGEPLEVNRKPGVSSDMVSNAANFERKIDIRGLYLADALREVQDFVDKALMSNAHILKIVHGKGSGVLRKAVAQKLKEYKDIAVVRHPEEEQGGNGVTIAEFGV